MRTGEPRSRMLATDCWFTENIGNLGKLRQLLIPKAWHIHGNPPHGAADFYPLLLEVGKDGIDDEGYIQTVSKTTYLMSDNCV
jgi:hypothetical protein